jgi:CDP-6-deoxy-D-xylo-4-hexulose-3-dehydrase
MKILNQNQSTPIKKASDSEELESIKNNILDNCKKYFQLKWSNVVNSGIDIIPASSKYLTHEDLEALVSSSMDLWLTSGPFTKKLEEKISKQFSDSYAKLTVSGSAANLLAFSALTSSKLGDKKIKPGDEVITVAAGFPTTVFPILQNNCIPVFLDINLDNYNINCDDLKRALTEKTKAVMIAHTMGNPFDCEKIKNFCDLHNLYLIEDCCDALGSTFKNKHVGTFGDFATLSFYPAHHITTGEGGAVITKKKSFLRLIESFRDWGRDCWCETGYNNTCGKRFGQKQGELPHGYDHKFIYSHIGYNLKITDMQAALGCSQFDKLDFFIEKRKENFNILKKFLIEWGAEKFFILPKATENSEPSWFGFLLTIKNQNLIKRSDLISWLESNKILTRLLFAGNLTKQPAFKEIQYIKVGNLENTDKVMNDSFWVGIYPALTFENMKYISETIKNFIKKDELI